MTNGSDDDDQETTTKKDAKSSSNVVGEDVKELEGKDDEDKNEATIRDMDEDSMGGTRACKTSSRKRIISAKEAKGSKGGGITNYSIARLLMEGSGHHDESKSLAANHHHHRGEMVSNEHGLMPYLQKQQQVLVGPLPLRPLPDLPPPYSSYPSPLYGLPSPPIGTTSFMNTPKDLRSNDGEGPTDNTPNSATTSPPLNRSHDGPSSLKMGCDSTTQPCALDMEKDEQLLT